LFAQHIPARIEPMSKETDTLSLIILKKNTGLKIKETKLPTKFFYKNQKMEYNVERYFTRQHGCHETKVIIYMLVHSQPKSEKNLQ